ncbi:MAG: FmdB family zinc ribbon protein [Dehalococcoidia bacterium]
MPRYDYKCESGHKYEKVQPFGSAPEHPCEKCGKVARRMLVAPPLVFKASGYYKTSGRDLSKGDSGASSAARSSKSDSKGDAKSGGDSGKAAETKAKRAERVRAAD